MRGLDLFRATDLGRVRNPLSLLCVVLVCRVLLLKLRGGGGELRLALRDANSHPKCLVLALAHRQNKTLKIRLQTGDILYR